MRAQGIYTCTFYFIIHVQNSGYSNLYISIKEMKKLLAVLYREHYFITAHSIHAHFLFLRYTTQAKPAAHILLSTPFYIH